MPFYDAVIVAAPQATKARPKTSFFTKQLSRN